MRGWNGKNTILIGIKARAQMISPVRLQISKIPIPDPVMLPNELRFCQQTGRENTERR